MEERAEGLGALVGANGTGIDGRHALIPLGGRPLLEYQVRSLAAAGADPILVYPEESEAALDALVRHLRHEGFPVHVAPDAARAARAVPPDLPILLLGDGVLPEPAMLAAVRDAKTRTVAVVRDGESTDGFERIDLERRWAGIALADGRALRATAAALGDWDLVSTTTRRLLQDGAPMPLFEGDPPLLVRDRADTEPVARRLAEQARSLREDMIARYALPPLDNRLSDWLAGTRFRPWMGVVLVAVLLQVMFVAMLFDYPVVAAVTGTLGVIVSAVPAQVAQRRLQALPGGWSLVFPAFAALPLIGLTMLGWGEVGWPVIPLCLALGGFMVSLRTERRRRPRALAKFQPFLFAWRAAVLIAAIATVAGQAALGLTVAMLYAAVSFLVIHQRPIDVQGVDAA